MYIIADVEWVQNKENKQSPTQLSAVRVDNEWNIVDEFSSYIQVTSIFNRTASQIFLLRLQSNNVYFEQPTPTLFWNYCTEFNSDIDKESEDI